MTCAGGTSRSRSKRWASEKAAIIASTVWICHDLGLLGTQVPRELSIVVAVLTAAIGFLMIANFPYQSFKGLDGRGRVPFVAIILLVFIFGLVTLDPPKVFLTGFAIYAASGPVMALFRGKKKAAS